MHEELIATLRRQGTGYQKGQVRSIAALCSACNEGADPLEWCDNRIAELESGAGTLGRDAKMKVRGTAQPYKFKALDEESQKVVYFDCYPCPNCGKWIAANENHRFCQHCGQALSWE